MQLLGSILVALAIVAATIAIVTSQLGPYAADDDGDHRDRIERIEDEDR